MLSGKYDLPNDFEGDDFRKFAPRFSHENFPKNLDLVNKIMGIAERKGCPHRRLAWELALESTFSRFQRRRKPRI
jgi:aryl-alcohol dehydrogenase-like predicted oxidoreductase